jgi:predicted transposase/invertase (TIGR01784 family)
MTDELLDKFINPFTNDDLKKIYTEANFKLSELANKSYEDRYAYELSLKYYRDFINVMDTAKKDGKAEGKLEGKMECELKIAKAMLKKNTHMDFIVEVTGLSKQILESLKSEITEELLLQQTQHTKILYPQEQHNESNPHRHFPY